MFSHHKHLQELSLNWTNIQPTTHAPLSVEVLSLKGNEIKQFLETCYNGTSSLFPELVSLDLSNNLIHDIPYKVCLTKLQHLNLLWNRVTVISKKKL
jgi:Leucine-rich repeat (LRR) protein